MLLSEFDYELPASRIAQTPLAARDGSRLLCLDRASGAVADRQFVELPSLLRPGDVLVANESRVFPARLHGRVGQTAAEVLLLHALEGGIWEALVRPGRKLRLGARLEFGSELTAEVVGVGPQGERRLAFHSASDVRAAIERLGHVPLPPYIRRPDEAADRERYQTVYAQATGSAAAPTAGLHFTGHTLEQLRERGVEWTTVTLHVGLGTFQPVTAATIATHTMQRERYEVRGATAAQLQTARAEGRRIIAVGTTAARVLETLGPELGPARGETELFLYPGQSFAVIDGLLTNFHAPRSTLLMMVAAFAGLEAVRRAYRHAIEQGYRFLSYGDCMLIT